MFAPSGFKLPAGATYKVNKASAGIYTITNAYAGHYEYFDNRPVRNDSDSSPACEAVPQCEGDASAVSPDAASLGGLKHNDR
jgi:hypothetical protein